LAELFKLVLILLAKIPKLHGPLGRELLLGLCEAHQRQVVASTEEVSVIAIGSIGGELLLVRGDFAVEDIGEGALVSIIDGERDANRGVDVAGGAAAVVAGDADAFFCDFAQGAPVC
jgi:hypothetical protein